MLVHGHERMIEMLQKDDGLLMEPDTLGQTPLYFAARNGVVAVMEKILESKVDPNQKGPLEKSPLWLASESQDPPIVAALLRNKHVNPDCIYNGKTPLWSAAGRGATQLVELLLGRLKDLGDINPNHSYQGQTPLSIAAGNGHNKVIESLLGNHMVKTNSPDPDGRTPFHLAILGGHSEVVDALLERDGWEWQLEDCFGVTPFQEALCSFQQDPEKNSILDYFLKLDTRLPLNRQICRYCDQFMSRLRLPSTRAVQHSAPRWFLESSSERCYVCRFILQEAQQRSKKHEG